MKEYVTNLKLSKQLKEVGVKQESIYRWRSFPNFAELTTLKMNIPNEIEYAAFISDELLKKLPSEMVTDFNYTLTIEKYDTYYSVCYNHEDTDGCYLFDNINFLTESLSDALGEMLLYLIKKELIEVK